MKKILLLLLSCSLTLLFSANLPGSVIGRCTDHLNVRVRPDTSQPALGMLAKGSEVTVLGDAGPEWLRIAAPKSVDVYVAAHLIRDGKTLRDTNVRTGPGVEFFRLATLPAGSPVAVKASSRKDWLTIEPPAKLSCFVARRYVSVSESSLAALGGKSVERVDSVHSVSSSGGKKAEEYPTQVTMALRRLFIPGSAKSVTVTGVVADLGKNDLGLSHALVKSYEDSRKTLYFLSGSPEQLKKQSGCKVKVTGIRQLVRNWNTPLLEIRSLESLQ